MACKNEQTFIANEQFSYININGYDSIRIFMNSTKLC